VARVHPEDRERVHDEFFAVVDNPETDYWSDEYRFLKTDGSYAAVLDRGYVLRDENGRAYRMIGAMQDITERKRAEGALRESEEKFRTLFEHAPVLIDGFDHNGRCTLWNKECERIFGWSQDEINSHDEPLALFYPDPIVRGQVIESVTSSPGTRFKEWHPMTREGKVLTVLWANFLLPEGSIINIGHDITERKHYEDVLTLAHRFFSISTQHQQIAPMLDEVVHTIQEYTGCEAVGIRLLDAAGNIPYPAYTGFDRSFYERESPLNILRDECMCIYIIRGDANPDLPVITQKGSFYCNGTTKFLAGISDEEKGRTRNVCNEEGYESVALVAIKRGDETIGLIHIADHREGMVPLETVKVLEDISQALGSAIQRLLAETGIRQALEEKEVLLREVHHRVKNNLAGILSLIGLQINSLSDPQQIAQLKELENRIRSMAQVHDSLSRTKDLARINVASYTENLTRHLLPASGTEGKVRYRIDMGDVVLPIETATPCGLVMNEIITNSLKYAFPKTFSCEEIRGEPCTITLTLHREGNDYLLGISDNGIGIPEGIGVTKSHTLGLFLIRFIVEHQLRGSIEISTKRGTAYMIRFRVPPVIEGKDYEKM
jgi:PAS domain S-box-containing protein